MNHSGNTSSVYNSQNHFRTRYTGTIFYMSNANIFKDVVNLTAIQQTETAPGVWNSTPQFIGQLTVQAEHLDEFGHTNNTIYLVWM